MAKFTNYLLLVALACWASPCSLIASAIPLDEQQQAPLEMPLGETNSDLEESELEQEELKQLHSANFVQILEQIEFTHFRWAPNAKCVVAAVYHHPDCSRAPPCSIL